MRISYINVQFQINAGTSNKRPGGGGGVYFKFDLVEPAFIRDPGFNRENTVYMKKHIYTADERLTVIDGGSPQLSRQLTQLRKESLKTMRLKRDSNP